MTRARVMRAIVLILAVLVAACGADSDPEPVSAGSDPSETPASTPAPSPPAPTATPATAGPPAVERQEHSTPATPRIDVYARPGLVDAPTLVLLHGGSDEGLAQVEDLARAIADQDVVVFAPGWPAITDLEVFRQDPQGALEAQTVAVLCALRDARADAAAFGGSGTRLGLVIDSQAGAVGLRVALAPGSAWPEAVCRPGIDHRPDYFVGLAGQYSGGQAREFVYPVEDWQRFDTFRHLGDNPDLDVMLIHSLGDTNVQPQQSEGTAATLRDAGYAVALIETDNGHASVLRPSTPTGALVVETVVELAHGGVPRTEPAVTVSATFDGDGCAVTASASPQPGDRLEVRYENAATFGSWLLVLEVDSDWGPDAVVPGVPQHFDAHPSFMDQVAFRSVEPGDEATLSLVLSDPAGWLVACAEPGPSGGGFTMYPGAWLAEPPATS